MADKDPQVEYNKSRALMDGATDSQVNNPNWMAGYQSSGDVNHKNGQKSGGGSAGGSCFAGDTPIMTPKGWVNISDFKKDDDVISVSNDGHKLAARKVHKLKRAGVGRIWNLSTLDKIQVQTTPWHSFKTQYGWKFAWQIKSGDSVVIVDKNGILSISEIAHSRKAELRTEVFNLITSHEHNFVAAGFVAHNYSIARRLRSLSFEGLLAKEFQTLAAT